MFDTATFEFLAAIGAVCGGLFGFVAALLLWISTWGADA
jgi:hypothetical protein